MDNIRDVIKKIIDWTRIKCKIHTVEPRAIFFDEREIWWAHLGQNVGSEINGKNEQYDRPVLIIKKFNKNMLWVLPMTTTDKDNKYYFPTAHEAGQRQSKVVLSQIRTISNLRLIKKQRTLPVDEFAMVREKLLDIFK